MKWDAPTVDNSRRSVRGAILSLLVLRELAQRYGLECLQGGSRGFESLSAYQCCVATVERSSCVRSEGHSARRVDISRSFFSQRPGSSRLGVHPSSEVTLGWRSGTAPGRAFGASSRLSSRKDGIGESGARDLTDEAAGDERERL
jgi:hypothetical protein